MIVEPVGAPRRSVPGFGNGLRIALPFVALVAVVGAGVLGRDGQTTEEGATVARATPGNAGTSLEPPSSTSASRTTDRAEFPDSLLGLPVSTTEETLRRRHEGSAVGVVAVSGYLSTTTDDAGCSPSLVLMPPVRPLCRRHGILADHRQSPFASRRDGSRPRLGPHLHPQFPPGTRLPEQADRTRADADGTPLPVVVLGRFDDPRAVACGPGGRHCGEEFVVESVAWVEGEPWRRRRSLDPLVGPELRERAWRARHAIEALALPGDPPILVAALVAPPTLRRVDPAAARAMPKRALEAVWLVRGLAVASGGPGRPPVGAITWAIVDAATGKVLASRPPPKSAAAALGP